MSQETAMRKPRFHAALVLLVGMMAGLARADDLGSEPTVVPSDGGKAATAPSEAPGTSLDDAPELMMFRDIPVVVAAGKREQAQNIAPASVSVIDANTIELF